VQFIDMNWLKIFKGVAYRNTNNLALRILAPTVYTLNLGHYAGTGKMYETASR